MAEPTKRTWPWKKKFQDKAVPESLESSPRDSPHNSKFFDEQDVSKILSEHARSSDEAMTHWQHSESKLKQLSDKLHAAQTELTAKDILVKQHAKVAEEAVTGWEKAEAEAAVLKQQLEKITHQKSATEDRVSHLDGALKECMRQLRLVREEQEQRIHETIVKKTREYDKLRQEMEAKLAEGRHDLEVARSELLESRGEVRASSIVLDEIRSLLEELNEAKARSEAEVRLLQVQLESTEKENSTSNLELQILRKELEIRNEEREYERRAAENAGKNQVENAKKIARLEAECQRLRILMRKKLPGPAALAQMKIEVDSLDGSEVGFDPNGKALGVGRSTRSRCKDSTRQLDLSVESSCDNSLGKGEPNREGGMDDELKMLKEALVRKEQELQVSRLMCAKTASKLSQVEEQLEITLERCKTRGNVTHSLLQREAVIVGDKSGDSWDAASALLAELDHFKTATNKRYSVGQVDVMDDFAEMERLAMATAETQPDMEGDCSKEEVSAKSFVDIATTLENNLIAKERELSEANRLHKEISDQLLQAEEKVLVLQSRNSANEEILVTLQAKLDMFCYKQGEDDGANDCNITRELEDLVEAQSISLRAGASNEATLLDLAEGSQNCGEGLTRLQRHSSSRSILEMKYEAAMDRPSVLSDPEHNSIFLASDAVLSGVRRVIQVVTDLVHSTGLVDDFSPPFGFKHHDGPVSGMQVYNFRKGKHPDLNSGMQRFFEVSGKLLQGKADIIDFLRELAAVLNYLTLSPSERIDRLLDRIEGTPDRSSTRITKESLWTVVSKDACFQSQSESLEGNLHRRNAGQMGVEGGFVPGSHTLKSMNIESLEGEHFDGGLLGCARHVVERQKRSIAKCEVDRDMSALFKTVTALEGERQRHQEVVRTYLDPRQQTHSQGVGSTSSGGLITKESPESEWGDFHDQYQSSDLRKADVRLDEDFQIQLAAEKCQHPVLGSPSTCDSFNASLESDTTCSTDEGGVDTDNNRLSISDVKDDHNSVFSGG